jgi:hypothetical protein
MLSQLDCHIFGLETIKEQYINDDKFKDVMQHCKELIYDTNIRYMMNFCLELTPVHSIWFHSSSVIVEGTGRRADVIFGAKKMEDVLATHFFWSRMRQDVENFVVWCATCQKAKSLEPTWFVYSPSHFFYSLG